MLLKPENLEKQAGRDARPSRGKSKKTGCQARINKEQTLYLTVDKYSGKMLKTEREIELRSFGLKLKRKRAKLAKVSVKTQNKASNMRLTVEQRLQALERDTVVLHDTIKLLHKLLKEQSTLINDYILQRVANTNSNDEAKAEITRPEDAIYTFICKQRFNKIERDIKRVLKSIENLRFGLKAG